MKFLCTPKYALRYHVLGIVKGLDTHRCTVDTNMNIHFKIQTFMKRSALLKGTLITSILLT